MIKILIVLIFFTIIFVIITHENDRDKRQVFKKYPNAILIYSYVNREWQIRADNKVLGTGLTKTWAFNNAAKKING